MGALFAVKLDFLRIGISLKGYSESQESDFAVKKVPSGSLSYFHLRLRAASDFFFRLTLGFS